MRPPPLPPGFVLQQDEQTPSPPPGFEVQRAPLSRQDAGRRRGEAFGQVLGTMLESLPMGLQTAPESLPRAFNLADELAGAGGAATTLLGNLIHGRDESAGEAYRGATDVTRDRLERQYEELGPLMMAQEGASAVGAGLLTGGAALPATMPSRGILGGMAGGGAAGGVAGAGAGETGMERAGLGALGFGIGAIAGPLAGVATRRAAQGFDAAHGGIRNILQRGAQQVDEMPSRIPTADQLREVKTAAYQLVDEVGAQYQPGAINTLVRRVQSEMDDFGVDPLRHPRAHSLLQEIRGGIDEPMTLQQMDRLRQVIRRDTRSDPAEREAGRRMIAAIDDFIQTAEPSVAAGRASGEAAGAITAARQANRQYRKAELFEDAIERATDRTSTSGVGGNFDNVMRQEVRRLYQNRATRDTFTEAERRAMQRFVRGSTEENILRGLSRFSPVGNSLSGLLTIGGTMAYGPLGAIPLAGVAAQAGSNRLRREAQEQLHEQLLLPAEQLAALQAQRGMTGQASRLAGMTSGALAGGGVGRAVLDE